MNVRRWFPDPAVAEYLDKLVVHLAQILPLATFAPAQMGSSCETVGQSVMVNFSIFWRAEKMIQLQLQLHLILHLHLKLLY